MPKKPEYESLEDFGYGNFGMYSNPLDVPSFADVFELLGRRPRWRHAKRDVVSFGVRFGYWPCVGGPFVQVNLFRDYFSFWYGEAFEAADELK